MNGLLLPTKENTISSLEVAEMVEKRHTDLLRDIKRYCDQLNESKIALVDFFKESTYIDAKGETRPCYEITKKGCEFIAHKLTGIKGTTFTAKYINRFHEMEDYVGQTKRLSPEDMMRIQLGMIDKHEERITALEETMTIDYGQQRTLENTVNKTVIGALGGKESNAYRKISKKVFAECNHDLKNYFNVNARNNVPKKRFDDAVEYAKNWKPCTNTQMLISEYNAQMTIE